MSLWTQNAEVKISGHSACRERNVRGNAAGAICCYHDWLLCSAVLRCATLAAVGGGVHQLLCFWHRRGGGMDGGEEGTTARVLRTARRVQQQIVAGLLPPPSCCRYPGSPATLPRQAAADVMVRTRWSCRARVAHAPALSAARELGDVALHFTQLHTVERTVGLSFLHRRLSPSQLRF